MLICTSDSGSVSRNLNHFIEEIALGATSMSDFGLLTTQIKLWLEESCHDPPARSIHEQYGLYQGRALGPVYEKHPFTDM